MKKLLSIILVLALMVTSLVLIAACNKETATYEIALVTDVGNIDDKSFNEGAWNGVKQFAEANGKTYGYFRPSEDSDESRIETIKTAIERGAKVVVCPGYLFEVAIYTLQGQYPNVNFLLLDGEPNDGAEERVYETKSNVHCILYKEEQAGYLAGYAAVMDGYRKLGFLGGIDVPAVVRFGFGFVQGAEAAGEELELAADAIELKYWYCGSFAPSDEIKTKMSGWYTAGTEVVFACGGGIYLSAIGAANETDSGKVIGVDTDMAGVSDRILTTALKQLTQSVKLALADFYENGGAWTEAQAGQTAVLGAAEDCVGLPIAETSWRFETYTVEEYEALFEKIKDGEIVIDDGTTTFPATTVVNLIDENEA